MDTQRENNQGNTMHKRGIIIIFMVYCFLPAFSQNNVSTASQETYNLYLAKKWDSLITKGKELLNNGMDFYYLRYRLGIAYFNKRKFRKAAKYFKKAYQMNDEDIYLKEYLYYSLLYGGQKNDAKALAGSFSEKTKRSLKIQANNIIEHAELSYSQSSLSNKSIATGQSVTENIEPYQNGYQYITQSFSEVNFGLGHRPFHRLTINHAYTYLHKSNYYFTKDYLGEFEDKDEPIDQNQYYINLGYQAAKGLNITMAFHYISNKYILDGVEYKGYRPIRTQEEETSSSNLFLIGAGKDLGNFHASGSISYSDLNGGEQFQKNISITWYPFSNLDLYALGTLSHLTDDKINEEPSKNWINYQKIGFTIKQKLWIEAFATTGDIKNYARSYGKIIYNNYDVMKKNIGGNIIIPLNKNKFVVTLTYVNSFYNSAFVDFIVGETGEPIDYNHNLIRGGIKWNF